jgi:enamine deaminase RidA (YjgF/YER057c/UK114 family)
VEIRAVNSYQVAVVHANEIYVAGQLPRARGQVAVVGRVGAETSFEEGRRAARICVVRALAVMHQALGSLERVERILRMTVYVHSAADFTQQSEVADAASEILNSLFAPNGGHTRTAVGVYQLPKNGAVEIDLVAAIRP